MAPSIYTPLPSDTSYLNIRLIRLQPSDNPSAPICCRLVCYPLVPDRSHLYECLSYVWGSPENPESVRIDTAQGFVDFDVTKSLHAALLQLRDPFFERVLWVDAICINQGDEEEKAQQVTSMTRIFGLASRVVVWLGEEADHSTLTFQHLRKLAQQQQPVTGHQQDDETNLRIKRSNELWSKDAYDVLALLNRTYFRRMWVLQEVTAARSVLFKCGQAELQGATFLAGLDGLPYVDDWKLRNRIRAFILLIQRSAFRESLKGQDQLHIDPLMDLIDRFHTYEATDRRDKIYALWGLSTESELTSILRPDYNKSWRNLLADLGLYVFGKDSELTPSESKQMLYVRSRCYYLGKVVTIYDAEMWDMEQRLEIASLRVTKFLNSDDSWNLTIKMRSSAEKISEGDIICFLPHTRKLIFARPESHFLRTISIIESRSVQFSTHNHEAPDRYWRPWSPFLNYINEEMVEVPFLWSWEQDTMKEGEEKWCLMRNHFPRSVSTAHNDAQDVLEAKILTEMATLHMNMDNYAAACLNISTVVDGYSSEHGPKAGDIDNSRECLDIALSRRSMYDKAKNILASREHNNVNAKSPGVFDLCFHVIFHIGMQLLLAEDSKCIREYIRFRSELRSNTAAHIRVEFAAVIMSQGVRKNMILDAIKMCDLNWFELQEIGRKDLHKEIELPPKTDDPHEDYLGFLLLMSDQNLRLSNRELHEAFRAKVSARNLNQLLKHCETTVDNLPDLIASAGNRTDRNIYLNSAENYLRSVLKGNADRVSITSDAILSALQLDSDFSNFNVVSVLVEAAQESGGVAPGTLDDLVRDRCHVPEDVVRDFANVLETQWHIGESTLLEIFSHEEPWSRRSKMILIALLENEKVTIDITEPVLGSLLGMNEEAVSFMMYRQDPSIMNGENILANYPTTKIYKERMLSNLALLEEEEWMPSNLALLQKGARSIRNKEDALSIPDSLCGYAQLLNLLRYRRAEFEITPDLFLRTIVQRSRDAILRSARVQERPHERELLESSTFNVTEKIGCCLIRYANDKEINALVESSELLNAIALGGYVPIMKDLRSRMNNTSPLFEVFRQVTRWSRKFQTKDSLRYFHGSQAYCELIESFETMFVPPPLQQTLLKLACCSMNYTKEYHLLEDLLDRDVIKVPLSLDFQEEIARLVLYAPLSSRVLNTLLEYKVIGANTTFKDGSTILHLFLDHLNLDQAESRAKNVEIVMQHGGAASIDAKNVRGETLRKMVKEILERETK